LIEFNKDAESFYEHPKIFIAVSSIMTWARTKVEVRINIFE